jgi:hypothetical protein
MPKSPVFRPPQAGSCPSATGKESACPTGEPGSIQPCPPSVHAPAVGTSPGRSGLARRTGWLGYYPPHRSPSATARRDVTPAREHCSSAQRPRATRTPRASARQRSSHGTSPPSADMVVRRRDWSISPSDSSQSGPRFQRGGVLPPHLGCTWVVQGFCVSSRLDLPRRCPDWLDLVPGHE